MNGDRLFEAIGEIDCDLVNNADTAKKVRIKPFKIVIALAAALVLAIVGTLGVTLGSILGVREKYNYYLNYNRDLHFDGTVGELLEFSKSKTVKDDIVNTVTFKDLYDSFGLFGGSVRFFLSPMVSSTPDPHYVCIMRHETNDFLKENQFGELYTVFKLDSGAYVYVIMSVDNDAMYDWWRFVFSRAYWVYDEVLTPDSLSGVVVGKTTLSDIDDIIYKGKVNDFRQANGPIFFDTLGNATAEYLTTQGTVKITFEKVGDSPIVSAMEFTEGCPINPEDII